MTKLLIFGSTGMLGHTLYDYFLTKNDIELYTANRNGFKPNNNKEKNYSIPDISKLSDDDLKDTIFQIKPSIIINCIGLVKQDNLIKNKLYTIKINSIFPLMLENICDELNIRLIHFSTDCVFSGIDGNYDESNNPDARDIYGLSKLMGECVNSKALTIRTSIVGYELFNKKNGLLEWFLNSKSEYIFGYVNAFFNGLTTLEVAKILYNQILFSNLAGLIHLSSNRISKFDFLCLVNDIYKLNLKIKKSEDFIVDRTLNSSRFINSTNYKIKSWKIMLKELKKFYEN